MYSQRRFEFMISQFGIALLLVLRKCLVCTAGVRSGGDERRVAIVSSVPLCGVLIIGELEAMLGAFATSRRRWKLLALRLVQRHHVVRKIGRSLSLPQQFADAARNRSGIRVASSLRDAALDLFQAFTNLGHRLLAIFSRNFLIRRAEDKDHAARDAL